MLDNVTAHLLTEALKEITEQLKRVEAELKMLRTYSVVKQLVN